ncbi:DUF2637 domain-containing protein [Actinoplanes sp. NPDC049316]|uniref:DUF2637 domain-containing protein n=1 Tax=Actinoplanes sp. NPDC049316 TaxID=3154727 RepID=UPI00341599C0
MAHTSANANDADPGRLKVLYVREDLVVEHAKSQYGDAVGCDITTVRSEVGHPSTAERDWWVIIGMTVAAISAALASFAGLRGLAQVAGWPDRLAWLLPVTIDAYAMTSGLLHR